MDNEGVSTMDISIRKVRSFVTIVELGSFRHAAEKLHISASALSTHIQQLEAALGVPLLHRTTRSVQITVQGQRFLSRARELIASVQSIVDELRDEADLRRTQVTIACVPTLMSGILPTAMATFMQRYPETKLRILDGRVSWMVRYVEKGEADFAIGSPPENGHAFLVSPLLEDAFVALMPINHPLAKQREIQFADLARYPFIGLKSSYGVRAALDRAARETGILLPRAFELVHHYSVGRLVEAGLGIAAVPSMTVPMVNMSGLVSLPIVAPRVTRLISIIRRAGSTLSRPAQQFLTILRSTVDGFNGKPAKTKTTTGVPRVAAE
jgi:DNA-binding transcriptional LysR family regulator